MGIPAEITHVIEDPEEDAVGGFCNFIQEIYACTKTDVIAMCQKLEINHLTQLRECLFKSLIEGQPSLHGFELRNRKRRVLS